MEAVNWICDTSIFDAKCLHSSMKEQIGWISILEDYQLLSDLVRIKNFILEIIDFSRLRCPN